MSKKIVSAIMLSLLVISTLALAVKIQPVIAVRAGGNGIVGINPITASVRGGESQIFSVVFISYFDTDPPIIPVSYQWFQYMTIDEIIGSPILGETNSTYNFTAPMDYSDLYISVQVTYSNGMVLESPLAWVRAPALSPYLSVEPVVIAPLTNLNASLNGLEIPPTPSAVGGNFTVEIHLRNATATNVPAGVAGVEVHFYFANILNYCKPIGFTDELGQTGSALIGPVLYGVAAGFYDDNWLKTKAPIAPPYSNATQYIVAAASTTGLTTGPWYGNDGLVVKITFQITGQPSQNMSQQDFYSQLEIGYGEVVDLNYNDVPLYVVQGTLHIDSAGALSLVGDLNGDGKVGLDDLILLANAFNSKLGDPNWNPMADVAPPYGIISLTDLVTLAIHYGQQYP